MIRQATENDAKDIAKIIVSGWQTTYRGIVSNEFLDNMSVEKMTESWIKNIKTQDENNNICVYEDENNILGVIRFGKADNLQSENGEIHVLYVKPEFKKQGIGTKLVKHAKEKLIKQKYKKMEIWCARENKPSIEFYKKMGGKLRNNRVAEINGVKIEEVELIYNLGNKINLIKPTKAYENQAIEYKQEHFNNEEKEVLEVYTEDNKRKIGLAERGVVHYFNLWHREIACWIINEKNEILMQRRSKLKKQYPNMLAVTAGHIDVNEKPIDATLREINEELGIKDVKAGELIFMGIFKGKKLNNYHFKYVYLLKTNKKLEDFTIQESEVSELLYIKLEELESMIKKPNNDITFAKQAYTPIIIEKIKELI